MDPRKNMRRIFSRKNITSIAALLFVFIIGFYAVNSFSIQQTPAIIKPFINNHVIDSEIKPEHSPLANAADSEINDINKREKSVPKKNDLENTYVDDNEKLIVKDPNDILVLVNKNFNLPEDYVPQDLIIPQVPFPFKEDLPKKHLRKVAASALEELFAAAKIDNIDLYAVSGYRSYQRQKAIYNNKVRKDGEQMAKRFVAYPGQSEHQTGLAMDVSAPNISFGLAQAFADSREGQWLAQNCYKFGFILRYPKGKEDITGYSYESWHIRYVGIDVANEIFVKNLTLEEYIEDMEENESPPQEIATKEVNE